MTNKLSEDKLFSHIGANQKDAEQIESVSITYFQDVRRRFLKNKVATVSLIILIILICLSVILPFIIDHKYTTTNLLASNKSPNNEFWFGTDSLGRDLFARIWQGGRVSFAVGFTAAFTSGILGVLMGSIAGFFGGKVDMLIMRIIDVMISIPYLIIVMLIMVVLNSGLTSIIIALTITGWLNMARLVRGQILTLKNEDYVLVAESLGVKPFRIMLRHLIPNTMGVIIVTLTMAIPRAIFSEAFLAFIGLGIAPPQTSWGQLANSGVKVMRLFPYQMWIPSIFISLTMLCLQLVGDGLRDALDPKLRQ
ncbi:ABC transporter permease [Mycoplasmatota bacterium]|nr:ABC transporter permease [Mycoplasmatota bacterium]